MLDDYERPNSSVNRQEIISSWVVTGVLFFGLFVVSMI